MGDGVGLVGVQMDEIDGQRRRSRSREFDISRRLPADAADRHPIEPRDAQRGDSEIDRSFCVGVAVRLVGWETEAAHAIEFLPVDGDHVSP